MSAFAQRLDDCCSSSSALNCHRAIRSGALARCLNGLIIRDSYTVVDIDIAPIKVSDSGFQTKPLERRVQTSLSQGPGCGVFFVASVRNRPLDATAAVLVASFCGYQGVTAVRFLGALPPFFFAFLGFFFAKARFTEPILLCKSNKGSVGSPKKAGITRSRQSTSGHRRAALVQEPDLVPMRAVVPRCRPFQPPFIRQTPTL